MTIRRRMTIREQEQYTIAGVIYGAIALVMLVAFGAGLYGLFQPLANPGLVPVTALFGMFAFGSLFTALFAFNRALRS